MNRTAAVLIAVLSVACNAPAPPPAATSAPPAAILQGPATPLAPASPMPDAQAVPGEPAGAVPQQLPPVLARVNGETIERWEFEFTVHGLESQAGQAVPEAQRDAIYRNILNQLIAQRLLAQEARLRKLQAPESEVNARIAQLRGTFPSEGAFTSALAAEGLTVDRLRDRARMDLLAELFVAREISPKVQVPPAEVEAFYKQNGDQFKEPEAVHAAHILIAIPEKADAAERQRRRSEAEALLKQVQAGASFAELARQRSQDTSSAARGGDLGFFSAGQMDPALEKAAFALKPGENSLVVETPYGFHIVRTIERRPARAVPLEEARPQIAQYLAEQHRQELIAGLVDELRNRGKVDVYI